MGPIKKDDQNSSEPAMSAPLILPVCGNWVLRLPMTMSSTQTIRCQLINATIVRLPLVTLYKILELYRKGGR
jgi:hypothetical protein